METSCGLVLVNYDSILLLQYPQGHWDFVKGHIEDADTSLQLTALRELTEETGIESASIVPGFQSRTQYQFTHKGEEIEKQVHWFIAETDEMVVNLSHEHIGFLWLSWDDALEQLTFENSKNVLMAAKQYIEQR
ncbi:MAG TPA: NUDIX domain-containing protein [Candidatus Thalassarchaeaceae archaeon]|jgi:8-oxo-dGTP pyrophosphatase MutT (NUDIX family)|nr:diadenosine tetraphosphate hydrolase [Euryarchaeota archaeon]MDP6378994.1 NUDIX domain-containing protein [Candidatus Thalassarchaeaceae archaeon]DAC50302.1 MAG TPA: NUDIX domain-containing protein [Candidatus Poseidoniales archaeon]HIH83076.1 NUDIX domain-containing protein [Candidatus Thalassarchaeaceae archaeon]|tara:strand:- start:6676 stop:7077 length:402 start_codon:yes stop_codon:yes gene_type:complete